MTTAKRIEKKAAKAGIEITIARADSWIGSKGKGKWAYSLCNNGGIYEPESAYPSLRALAEAIDDKIAQAKVVGYVL